MTLFVPLRGLCPPPERAADVIELPYDVMSRAEAAAMAAGRPDSFLRVSRPEIDLPDEVRGDDPLAYEHAALQLAALRRRGVLQQDALPSFYVYRLTRGRQQQTGVIGGASVAAYEAGRIARHELTRADKQADRANHIAVTHAQTGPAFLVYPRVEAICAVTDRITTEQAPTDVTGPGGIRHEVWPVTRRSEVSTLVTAFATLPRMYIADGHHRSAAAALVHQQHGRPRNSPSGSFLAAAFPADEVRILPYNRVVRDLSGRTTPEFLAAVSETFQVEPAPAPIAPYQAGDLGMYLAGQWYTLQSPSDLRANPDPVDRLDVAILQEHLLAPLLGIDDPRTDPRIGFVGGVRGVGELSTMVDSAEWAVAFSLFPPTISDLIAVADAGQMMPPKSTWFEPKLADGLVSQLLD
ncbi:MAG: DUF1015 domain-containing protein [Candidatus Nanopelagicales bacterium]